MDLDPRELSDTIRDVNFVFSLAHAGVCAGQVIALIPDGATGDSVSCVGA